MTASPDVLDQLATEVEFWDATLRAQRLLHHEMNHAPTSDDRRRAALVSVALFTVDGALAATT